MNYIEIYKKLIMKRMVNPVPNGVYHERHHIVPSSEGGSDDADNVINLTAREHYVAHLLLAKIYDDYKMHCAITYMIYGNKRYKNLKFNSHLYEKLKQKRSKFMSKKLKGNKNGLGYKFTNEQRANLRAKVKGKGNPFYGRHHSEETKRKISAKCKGHPWNGGGFCEKNMFWWNNGVKNVRTKECPPGFVPGRIKNKKQ